MSLRSRGHRSHAFSQVDGSVLLGEHHGKVILILKWTLHFFGHGQGAVPSKTGMSWHPLGILWYVSECRSHGISWVSWAMLVNAEGIRLHFDIICIDKEHMHIWKAEAGGEWT